MRIHFYHTKEQLLTKTRQLDQLPALHTKLQLYADISLYTRQLRHQLNTITKPLNIHKIPYQWGFPTKIIATKNGKKHTIYTVEEGLQLPHSWGIIPEPPAQAQANYRGNNPSLSRCHYANANALALKWVFPIFTVLHSGLVLCLLQPVPQTFTPHILAALDTISADFLCCFLLFFVFVHLFVFVHCVVLVLLPVYTGVTTTYSLH